MSTQIRATMRTTFLSWAGKRTGPLAGAGAPPEARVPAADRAAAAPTVSAAALPAGAAGAVSHGAAPHGPAAVSAGLVSLVTSGVSRRTGQADDTRMGSHPIGLPSAPG